MEKFLMQLGFQGLEGWSRDKNEKEGQVKGWRDQEGLCICMHRLVMRAEWPGKDR